MFRLWAATCGIWVSLTLSVFAQDCGGTYVVRPGESLSLIANMQYKDARKWTAIHAANLDLIGEDPDTLFVGLPLRLGCINGLPVGLAGAVRPPRVVTETVIPDAPVPYSADTRINLVTAGDFAPFTDPALENGGLLADVVNAALEAAHPPGGHKVHWINDWSSHLDPLMSGGMMDMAFPWYQPDCTGDPSQYRCENFLFSVPMFEMLIVLFVDTDRPVPFVSDADMEGRTLCRPAGYFVHDLDRADRRWLSQSLITLEQPKTVSDCFVMLRDGQVDAVAINEFTGREAIKTLGLEASVDIVPGRALSIEGLHVLVHKDHPHAASLLDTINTGLTRIKHSGQYQRILDRHMSAIWAGL